MLERCSKVGGFLGVGIGAVEPVPMALEAVKEELCVECVEYLQVVHLSERNLGAT